GCSFITPMGERSAPILIPIKSVSIHPAIQSAAEFAVHLILGHAESRGAQAHLLQFLAQTRRDIYSPGGLPEVGIDDNSDFDWLHPVPAIRKLACQIRGPRSQPFDDKLPHSDSALPSAQALVPLLATGYLILLGLRDSFIFNLDLHVLAGH